MVTGLFTMTSNGLPTLQVRAGTDLPGLGTTYTFDRDFGALVVGKEAPSPPAILYLRLPRMAVNLILQRLGDVLGRGDTIEGSLIVIAPTGERRRELASGKQDENG